MEISKEASPKARRLINKRKLYGVGVEIRDYKREIIKVFYDEEIIKKLFKRESVEFNKESFNFVDDYFNEINRKIAGLLEKAKEFLLNSFFKGSIRVQDKDGNAVSFGEVKDKSAIDILINQQTAYYKNLTEEQSKRVNQIIAKGLRQGKSYAEVAAEIKLRIKRLTFQRADNIARSEIVKSHSLGQMQTMKETGIKFYNYITSDDNKVSEICKHNQGPKGREKKYLVDLAGTPENPLPVTNSHPRCRCCTVIWKEN